LQDTSRQKEALLLLSKQAGQPPEANHILSAESTSLNMIAL